MLPSTAFWRVTTVKNDNDDSSYSRCHTFPIYFSQCGFIPPSKRTGQLVKRQEQQKLPQQIPHSSGGHSKQWKTPRSLWDPATPSQSWKSPKESPDLEGAYGPLESKCNFLKCIWIFFFFQRRNFLVFTGFCEVVVTRQKLRLLIESKPLVFQR